MAVLVYVNNDAFFRSIGKPYFERSQYEDIFRQIDTDDDGVISEQDMAKYMQFSQFRNVVQQHEIKRCFREANRKGDGKVTVDEFRTVMAFFSPSSSSLGLGKLSYPSPIGKYGKFKDQRGIDMLALRYDILKEFVMALVKKPRLGILKELALEAYELSRDAPELKDEIRCLVRTAPDPMDAIRQLVRNELTLEERVDQLERRGPAIFAITE